MWEIEIEIEIEVEDEEWKISNDYNSTFPNTTKSVSESKEWHARILRIRRKFSEWNTQETAKNPTPVFTFLFFFSELYGVR